jgi:mono/diheme cytochrome c family protein
MKRALLLLMCCGTAGCGQNMETQPKYYEYEPAPLFRDGRVLQAPVAGTVARGDLERAAQATQKPRLGAELLARGQQEFDVFCSPCHGRLGDGNGMVVQRGMPRPHTFHEERLRQAPDQHFFDAMTAGYGAMYSYAERVNPRDRWAIVAYVRALQLSQHATLDDVPAAEQERLRAEASQ